MSLRYHRFDLPCVSRRLESDKRLVQHFAMTIAFKSKEDLIKLTVTGQLTAIDLYRGINAIFEATTPPKMRLWDVTGAVAPDAEDFAEQLRKFSIYSTERGKSENGARVAVVSLDDVQFGLARMSASLAAVNQATYPVKIFRDSDSAKAWLSEAVNESERESSD